MSEFTRVISVGELAPGTCMETRVGSTAVALCNVQGTYYAISNTCVHRGGPLGQGYLDGRTVLCPWHAWAYDLATGESTANPDIRLPCFEVKLEDGGVYVKAG